jgi:hypothetical protein
MIRRRLVPVLSVALLAMAMAALPAAADSPSGQAESYAAQAQGSALTLSLMGQELSVGAGQASIDSTPKANANASGVLLLTTPVGASSAAATQNGQSVSDGTPSSPTCSPLSLPSTVPVAGLTTGCSFSQAAIADGLPTATAGGQSVNLSVGTSSLTALNTQLEDLVTQLNGALSGVLGNILDPLSGGAITTSQLGTLLNTLTTSPDAELVTVQVGTSTSTANATTSAVTASSTSTGGTICVGSVAGVCLVKITVGQASATAVRNRSANTATPTVDPSIVKIEILPALFDGLSQLPGIGDVLKTLFPNPTGTPTLTLQQGQTFSIPQLGLTLVASSGTTNKTSDGATASASSLKLSVLDLPGLNGGVSLALADANAAVAGKAAVAPPATPATTAPPKAPTKLAYTGSNEPWRPIAAGFLVLLAIAGFEVARRARRRHVEY